MIAEPHTYLRDGLEAFVDRVIAGDADVFDWWRREGKATAPKALKKLRYRVAPAYLGWLGKVASTTGRASPA